MEKSIKVYVGLDGDNDSIAVEAADGGGGAARFVGQIGHDLAQLLRVLSRLEFFGKTYCRFTERGEQDPGGRLQL